MKATTWYRYARSRTGIPFSVTLLSVERVAVSECIEATFRRNGPEEGLAGIKPATMKLTMGRAETIDMARRLLKEVGEEA
jgi:hypothetical protein